MFTIPSSPQTILSDIEKIYDKSGNSGLVEELLSEACESIGRVKAFLDCNTEEAVVMSIMIYKKIFYGKCSIDNVIEHLLLKNSNAPHVNEIIKPFLAKDWMTPERDPFFYPLTEYQISFKLLRSILGGKMLSCEMSQLEDSYELLEAFNQKLKKRKERKINYDEFCDWSGGLLNNHPNLEISQYIRGKQLDSFESISFLTIACEHYNGNEELEPEDIINQILPPKTVRYRLRNDLLARQHPFFKYGVIEEVGDKGLFNYMDQCKFRLTEMAVRSFDPEYKPKTTYESSILIRKEHHTLHEVELVFDKQVQKMYEKLGVVLQRDKLSEICTRMTEQGMKPGLSILLYGPPGTGKTETVYQLAKRTDRNIMVVEANRIRSKWVGETEKNIKKVFEEYRRLMKNEFNTPILLFNEADAIISKRHDISDRGDQMENTMQNIILEELENFEGIFMATTNLIENFDKAFDRRFLYKLRLEKPSESVMLKIWKQKFPQIKQSILKKLSQQFSLSGGQIENIRKKILVDGLLSEQPGYDVGYLTELIEGELLIGKTGTRGKVIGFLR